MVAGKKAVWERDYLFSCTAVILVIVYIQEWRGVGCRLEKVSWWAIQTANVCNCVKCTLPIGLENAGKEIGGGMENAGKGIGGGMENAGKEIRGG